jgi:DNA-directed RNA polymerase subunit RPC12/RpoP
MKVTTQYRQCPYCGSKSVRNSHIHPWSEKVGKRLWLKVTMQRPYRCLDCDKRFFDLRFKRRVESFRKAA